jgi:hypothetical protein
MIEARTENQVDSTPPTTINETPQRITITMVLKDLEDGTDRNGIKEKYNLEAWEVSQMFKHPALKGKKAKKVRKLSFDFVDDTDTLPGQVDLEDAIAEETSMKDAMIDEMNGRKEMDSQDQMNEMDDEEDELITDEIGREVVGEDDDWDDNTNEY